MKNIDYSLYLVTDRDLISTGTLLEAVEKSILGGATLIQLREKNLNSRAFLKEAYEIKSLTEKYDVPLIINDRIDIAQCVDAAGVHLGQKDIDIESARKILGAEKIIGISASNLKEALEAEAKGADYLGVGAIFPTSTKDDATSTSLEELRAITKSVKIPVVAIGGLNEGTVPKLKNCGLSGYAIVSAIMSKTDIKLATENFKKMYYSNESN
ncbi:thiamine phosphate synthase [Anaerosphaera multitolerans]|uniref:Thiamine-phosphate synthase n=1 Tax=Anaerosphaera multitolerans TaxID=2487351 RepID=A0A437S4T1_9FIRM|nr:thiamine phosphate synthase [Anaerosphaera multitolerans]RVU53988.1 thiamine phosphate synthase [Anaerosphaera multitolerans]